MQWNQNPFRPIPSRRHIQLLQNVLGPPSTKPRLTSTKITKHATFRGQHRQVRPMPIQYPHIWNPMTEFQMGFEIISTYKPQDGGEESDSSLRIKNNLLFLVFCSSPSCSPSYWLSQKLMSPWTPNKTENRTEKRHPKTDIRKLKLSELTLHSFFWKSHP